MVMLLFKISNLVLRLSITTIIKSVNNEKKDSVIMMQILIKNLIIVGIVLRVEICFT